MKIIFGRNKRPVSLFIRLATWSRYSHVGIILEDGRVLESTFSKGVHTTSLTEFTNRYSKVEEAYIEGTPHKALKQLGKKYDWRGVLGILFRRKSWNDPAAWWCSELIAICVPFFRNTRLGRITPEHIFMVSKEK
jgi:uncharacterized protein YycO